MTSSPCSRNDHPHRLESNELSGADEIYWAFAARDDYDERRHVTATYEDVDAGETVRLDKGDDYKLLWSAPVSGRLQLHIEAWEADEGKNVVEERFAAGAAEGGPTKIWSGVKETSEGIGLAIIGGNDDLIQAREITYTLEDLQRLAPTPDEPRQIELDFASPGNGSHTLVLTLGERHKRPPGGPSLWRPAPTAP